MSLPGSRGRRAGLQARLLHPEKAASRWRPVGRTRFERTDNLLIHNYVHSSNFEEGASSGAGEISQRVQQRPMFAARIGLGATSIIWSYGRLGPLRPVTARRALTPSRDLALHPGNLTRPAEGPFRGNSRLYEVGGPDPYHTDLCGGP
jgi:hypothetical protein